MGFFGKKSADNKGVLLLSDQIIEVDSVEDEYALIDNHLSEAGAPLQIVKRESNIVNKYAFDHFTLMCSESGVLYKIVFKVKAD
jgi:hypothetical protein